MFQKVVQTVPSNQPVNGISMESQELRGGQTVSFGSGEGLNAHLAGGLVHRVVESSDLRAGFRRAGGKKVLGKVLEKNLIGFPHGDRALNQVLQFSNVAGPRVLLKYGERFLGNSGNSAVRMRGPFPREVIGQ